jgi:hypothetical protein
MDAKQGGSSYDSQFPEMLQFTTGEVLDLRDISLPTINIPLVDPPTMATVARQATFGNQPFQWGTDLLRGCTMFLLVSKKAVYFVRKIFTDRNGIILMLK